MGISIGFEKSKNGANPIPAAQRNGLGDEIQRRVSMPKGADPLEAARRVDQAEERERQESMLGGAVSVAALRKKEPAEERQCAVSLMEHVARAFREHQAVLTKRRKEILEERSRINNMVREIDIQSFEVEMILDVLSGAK